MAADRCRINLFGTKPPDFYIYEWQNAQFRRHGVYVADKQIVELEEWSSPGYRYDSFSYPQMMMANGRMYGLTDHDTAYKPKTLFELDLKTFTIIKEQQNIIGGREGRLMYATPDYLFLQSWDYTNYNDPSTPWRLGLHDPLYTDDFEPVYADNYDGIWYNGIRHHDTTSEDIIGLVQGGNAVRNRFMKHQMVTGWGTITADHMIKVSQDESVLAKDATRIGSNTRTICDSDNNTMVTMHGDSEGTCSIWNYDTGALNRTIDPGPTGSHTSQYPQIIDSDLYVFSSYLNGSGERVAMRRLPNYRSAPTDGSTWEEFTFPDLVTRMYGIARISDVG